MYMNLIGENIYISDKAKVADGVTIYHGAFIGDGVVIGKGTTVYQNAVVLSSTIGQDCIIGQFSLTRDSKISNNVTVGPYSEVARSTMEDGSAVYHKATVVDVTFKKNSMMGANSVIANANLKTGEKTHTTVEEEAKVGANVTILSPVVIGKNSIVGANTFVNKDVAPNTTYYKK